MERSQKVGNFSVMQEENQALQQMVVDLAANKREAKERLAGLKEDYNHLISEVRCPLLCG